MRSVLFGCLVLVALTGCNNTSTGGKADAGKSTSGTATSSSAEATPRTTASGAVYPSIETIQDGSYSPLSRPLFVYVNVESLQKRPQVALFAKKYLEASDSPEMMNSAHIVRVPSSEIEKMKARLAAANPATAEEVKGPIVVDGSSTVYPLSQGIAEEFQKAYPDVEVGVAESGTGGGFKKFCLGEIDITGASRPIDEKEKALCERNKVQYVELLVALDGITVVVNPKNTWCKELTIEQLNKLWRPDNPVSNWKDLNPEWPDKPIQLYGADADSGTFEFFTEAVNEKKKSCRTDYTPAGDDNIIVQGVVGGELSLGYLPFSYYDLSRTSLTAVAIVPKSESSGESKPVDGAEPPKESTTGETAGSPATEEKKP